MVRIISLKSGGRAGALRLISANTFTGRKEWFGVVTPIRCCDVLNGRIAGNMSVSERITMDPEICHGKPTIRGLRYTVESILELLSSGMAVDEILADYEDLEREDILAALDFARQLSQIKRIEPLVA
jgi:uncharacterized protein (DUF433 family)